MLKRIRHTGRELLSPDAWKARLLFWVGAVVVGLLDTALAMGTERAKEIFLAGAQRWPDLPGAALSDLAQSVYPVKRCSYLPLA